MTNNHAMEIKTTRRHRPRQTQTNSDNIANIANTEDAKNRAALGMPAPAPPWGTAWRVLKLRMCSRSATPAIVQLGIRPGEMKTYIHTQNISPHECLRQLCS